MSPKVDLNHKYLYQGYSMDSLFQSARGPCRLESFAAPSSSGPGHDGPLRTILCHCCAPLLRLSHRQPPPPAQTASHWLILYTLARDVASLPAQLLCCICQPLAADVEAWLSCAGGAGVGWSEYSCLGGTGASRARAPAHRLRGRHTEWVWVRARTASARP